jgi:hypothetical protein
MDPMDPDQSTFSKRPRQRRRPRWILVDGFSDFLPLSSIFPSPNTLKTTPPLNPLNLFTMSAEEVRTFLLQIRVPPMAVGLLSQPRMRLPLFSRARGHVGLLTPPYGQIWKRLLTSIQYSTMSPSSPLMPEPRRPTPCSVLLCARTATL